MESGFLYLSIGVFVLVVRTVMLFAWHVWQEGFTDALDLVFRNPLSSLRRHAAGIIILWPVYLGWDAWRLVKRKS